MTPWALYPQTPLPVTLDSVTGRFPIMTTSSPHTHKAHPRSKWKWKINEKRLSLSLDKFFKGFPYLCFSLGWYLVDYVWGNSAWRTRQSDQPETKSGSFENYFAKSFWDTLPATQKQQMDKGQFLIFLQSWLDDIAALQKCAIYYYIVIVFVFPAKMDCCVLIHCFYWASTHWW